MTQTGCAARTRRSLRSLCRHGQTRRRSRRPDEEAAGGLEEEFHPASYGSSGPGSADGPPLRTHVCLAPGLGRRAIYLGGWAAERTSRVVTTPPNLFRKL